MSFDFQTCRPEHRGIAKRYIGDLARKPDLVITTDDNIPYLFRWHVISRNYDANVYFHVQTSSDPERPLHDHPWDNFTTLLANAYDEIIQGLPPHGITHIFRRAVGESVHRSAEVAHRLILPEGTPYVMTLFTTGVSRRKWGFWIGETWYDHGECTEMTPNGSVFRYPPGSLPREDLSPPQHSHGHY